MKEYPHFAEAPIVEALLNLRTPAQPVVILESLRTAFTKAVEADYPIVQSLGELRATISAGQGVSAAAEHQQTGLVLRSLDGREALQARLDGFAYSRFAPYDRWETFRDAARRFWDVYRIHVADIEPTVIGIRTINSIPIPAGSRIERYLRVYPALPEHPDFPQVLQNFVMRLQLPVSDDGSMLSIQTGYLQPTEPNSINMLLDLDFNFPRRADVPLWEQIDGLREIKDRIFLDALTDEMKGILHAGRG